MLKRLVADGPGPENGPALSRVITVRSVLGAVGVTLFVATEAFAGAAATTWAVSGLLHLGAVLAVVLGIAAFASAGLLTVLAARMAWLSETDPANN